jgi:hypothetical protein
MNAKTQEIMNQMVAHAKAGNVVIPMFFQPGRGTSNSVSAAVRAAKKLGLLVQDGLDGCGKPKYRAAMPAATHAAPAMAQ